MSDQFQKRTGGGIKEDSPFFRNVIQQIKRIPRGQVATYGQIAKLAGKPQGSRGVGWILHSSTRAKKLPWQRVINSQGQISFPADTKNFRLQRKLLMGEGVEVSRTGKVSLSQFQWKKTPRLRKTTGRPRMFT